MLRNYQNNLQVDEKVCRNRIIKLNEMLVLNRAIQQNLEEIKKKIEYRKKQLIQIDDLIQNKKYYKNNIFDINCSINQIKKIPEILYQQELIKKNCLHQFGFFKNICNFDLKSEKYKNTNQQIHLSQQQIISNLSNNAKYICFVVQAQKLNKQGIQLYKLWKNSHRIQNTIQKNKLIMIDENKLIQKKKIYGDNWQKIGYFFNNFTFQDLYYYFQKHLNKISTRKWSLQHNLMLIALVEYYGSGKWALISKKLKIKSQIQIRERYCNVLDPKIKQNKWNQNDQKLLLQIAQIKNYKWSKITKDIPEFKNKTDNALRRKFRNLMIKKDNQDICKFIKDKKLRQSILKFKKDYYNRNKNSKIQQDDQIKNNPNQ